MLKFIAVLTFLFSLCVPIVGAAEMQAQSLLISRIKTGGAVSGEPNEYVDIHNQANQQISLTGWKLEYAKPSARITDCEQLDWKQQDSSTNVKVVELTGSLEANTSARIELSMNDNAGGSLRLINTDGLVDLVGWGNSISQGPCKETDFALVPENTKSIWRVQDVTGTLIDTQNNKLNFMDVAVEPEPSYGDPKDSSPEDVCSNLDGPQATIPDDYQLIEGTCVPIAGEQVEVCIGVVISEILPNPAGTDTNFEYIELNNTTQQPVDLGGCNLKVGSTSKALDGVIEPGYKAFYGVTLPNAAGGSVEFITPTTEEVVMYPAGLKDDIAWALIDGEWQQTNQPTPGAANKGSLITSEPIVSAKDSLGPCPAGKYRNPATNRCKAIAATSGLKPCDPGQYRNPETNRCKSTATTLTSLKPCSPGQVRNPATNRCKKADSSGGLKPCAEGQERNPETNRCRKVAGANTNTPSSELNKAVNDKRNISFTVLGVVAALALAYGVFEYRTSIANYFARFRLNK